MDRQKQTKSWNRLFPPHPGRNELQIASLISLKSSKPSSCVQNFELETKPEWSVNLVRDLLAWDAAKLDLFLVRFYFIFFFFSFFFFRNKMKIKCTSHRVSSRSFWTTQSVTTWKRLVAICSLKLAWHCKDELPIREWFVSFQVPKSEENWL